MSKYTTELRYIVETSAGLTSSVGNDSIDETITKALPVIFNFNFPIFDESYREVLERKIINHFYTREIGYETVGRWKLALKTKLNEIMPYYNKLYESELLDFNPLYTHNLHTKRDDEETRNTQQTTTQHHNDTIGDVTRDTTVGTDYRLHSDTPQGGLTGVDSETYLSDAQKVTTNNTVSGTADRSDIGTANGTNTIANTNVDDYLEHVSGWAGYSPNKLVKEYRDNFLNIDMMIIKDLNKLFMGLW